jgi:hypothetical protein
MQQLYNNCISVEAIYDYLTFTIRYLWAPLYYVHVPCRIDTRLYAHTTRLSCYLIERAIPPGHNSIRPITQPPSPRVINRERTRTLSVLIILNLFYVSVESWSKDTLTGTCTYAHTLFLNGSNTLWDQPVLFSPGPIHYLKGV